LSRGDVARLTLLGAIWGGSFLFIRIVSPAIGPLLTADLRMLVAGIALVAWFRLAGFDPRWRLWLREYAIAGMLTSGIPFLLFAYAALSLTAGQMAVLNATSPMWGAIMAAALLGERLRARRVAGLALGVAGVALIARPGG
jgi:drug/metabolite transporter (DMT)-like permease